VVEVVAMQLRVGCAFGELLYALFETVVSRWPRPIQRGTLTFDAGRTGRKNVP
jgi:hypothetical protein